MNLSIEALIRYFSAKGAILFLESQSANHPWSRKSYLAAYPTAIIRARNNKIESIKAKKKDTSTGDPWLALNRFRQRHDDWLFGYWGYDLKNHVEDLSSSNTDAVGAPDMFFMIPGFLAEIDRETEEYTLLKGELPGREEIAPYVMKEDQVPAIEDIRYNTSPTLYIDKIKEAQRRITEGEFYEINISHQLEADFEGDPLMLYRCMKAVGPVPFGAFIQIDDWTVCCQSPERFLRKEGNKVFSQPIKGTAKRGESMGEDESLKQELIGSQKEKAENLMIVDLVRNDLSRIARQGSVQVSKLFEIESFGTVHQMVSTVMAEAEEEDPVRIIKACFPMGSMTGTPKIRAMKTIEELEEYRRGIYSGAIGYIRPNGDFDFNVVIRTAIVTKGKIYYSVGGAITSDSDPEAEWEETLVKAQALLEAVKKNISS